MSNMEYITCKLLHDGFNRNMSKMNSECLSEKLQIFYNYAQNGFEINKVHYIPKSIMLFPRGQGFLSCFYPTPIYERINLSDEYRKFIEENRYGRIANPNGSLSIPRIQFTHNNGNNIKYASRRLLDDMGK